MNSHHIEMNADDLLSQALGEPDYVLYGTWMKATQELTSSPCPWQAPFVIGIRVGCGLLMGDLQEDDHRASAAELADVRTRLEQIMSQVEEAPEHIKCLFHTRFALALVVAAAEGWQSTASVDLRRQTQMIKFARRGPKYIIERGRVPVEDDFALAMRMLAMIAAKHAGVEDIEQWEEAMVSLREALWLAPYYESPSDDMVQEVATEIRRIPGISEEVANLSGEGYTGLLEFVREFLNNRARDRVWEQSTDLFFGAQELLMNLTTEWQGVVFENNSSWPDYDAELASVWGLLVGWVLSVWGTATVPGRQSGETPSDCPITSRDYWAWWFGYHVIGAALCKGSEFARLLMDEAFEDFNSYGWPYGAMLGGVLGEAMGVRFTARVIDEYERIWRSLPSYIPQEDFLSEEAANDVQPESDIRLNPAYSEYWATRIGLAQRLTGAPIPERNQPAIEYADLLDFSTWEAVLERPKGMSEEAWQKLPVYVRLNLLRALIYSEERPDPVAAGVWYGKTVESLLYEYLCKPLRRLIPRDRKPLPVCPGGKRLLDLAFVEKWSATEWGTLLEWLSGDEPKQRNNEAARFLVTCFPSLIGKRVSAEVGQLLKEAAQLRNALVHRRIVDAKEATSARRMAARLRNLVIGSPQSKSLCASLVNMSVRPGNTEGVN